MAVTAAAGWRAVVVMAVGEVKAGVAAVTVVALAVARTEATEAAVVAAAVGAAEAAGAVGDSGVTVARTEDASSLWYTRY